MKLIIQIPCYNEAEMLPRALADLPRRVAGMGCIEALGIAAIDVSPAYWRTLGNRLAARLALPEYTTERHTAWLAGKVLP